MVAGIYQIWNTVSNDKFIGSSTFADQIVVHYVNGLRKHGKFLFFNEPKATSCKLALDWKLYGELAFKWGVIRRLSGNCRDVNFKCFQFCREVCPTYNTQSYLPLVSGVYRILNISTGESYIGQSKDIYMRWHQHRVDLRRNGGSNKALQESFNKHGCEEFKFEILEQCLPDKTILTLLERSWIARTPKVFNVR